MIAFANVDETGERPDRVTVRPLLSGSTFTISLVEWPSDTERHECRHDGAEEVALILGGSIHDEDGIVHERDDLWYRSADEVHRPRSGPDGARLLLLRVTAP